MEQSASLPGRLEPSRRPLRRVRSRALRAALRARAAVTDLSTIWRPFGGMLFEELGQLGVDRGLDQRADLGVAQLCLGLALELRVLELDRDDRRETFADVFAGQVLFFLFEQALLASVVVDGARERAAKARQVGPALGGVDVVGEGEDRVVVRRVPLHGDFDLTVGGLVFEVDHRAMDGVFVAVDVVDEVAHAAGVLEHGGLALGALVDELDAQVLGEEGRLAQALRQHAVVVLDLFEDVGVGHEGHDVRRRGVFGELFEPFERPHGDAALEALMPVVAVAVDVELEPRRQRVDHRDADAVQAAGDLVAGAAELAAGVQHGEHDLGGRLVVLGHDAHRDAATVVDHDHRVVGLDGDGDAVGIAGEGFVDRVVDDLVHQMVEAARPGGADVHAGTFADRVEALEDGDVLLVVPLFGAHCTSPEAG